MLFTYNSDFIIHICFISRQGDRIKTRQDEVMALPSKTKINKMLTTEVVWYIAQSILGQGGWIIKVIYVPLLGNMYSAQW